MHDHDVTVYTETPHEEEETTGCCVMPPERRIENLMDLERADSNIEIARVKVADAEVRILRASNYVKVSTNGVRVSIEYAMQKLVCSVFLYFHLTRLCLWLSYILPCFPYRTFATQLGS